jgi:hypothetical protein
MQSPLLSAAPEFWAISVPVAEVILSGLLLFKRFRSFALHSCLTVMVAFCAYIVAITKFSHFIPCSCGGILEQMTWDQHLLFNFSFVSLGIIAILMHSRLSDL